MQTLQSRSASFCRPEEAPVLPEVGRGRNVPCTQYDVQILPDWMRALRRPGLILLGGILFAALFSCRTIDWTLGEAKIPCGVYRWRIKTLSDGEAEAVRLRPIDARGSPAEVAVRLRAALGLPSRP